MQSQADLKSDYSFFDVDYYQGSKKMPHRADDYKKTSREAPIYKEIAESLFEIFGPRRYLEIGCATGIIVRYLNEMGAEAHGIDVSQWAIENREHKNVQLAGAEALPHPDGYFDVIYSLGAIEHIPIPLKDAGLSEMTRVSAPQAVHFHMVPIIGIGAYSGDRERAIRGLQGDPTHHLLLDKSEWMREWGPHGWRDTGYIIAIENDFPTHELSECQLLLSRTPLPESVKRAINTVGAKVVRNQFHHLLSPARVSFEVPGFSPFNGSTIIYHELRWKEVFVQYEASGIDLREGQLRLIICAGEGGANLRVALGSGPPEDPWCHSVTAPVAVSRGFVALTLGPKDYQTDRGDLDFGAVRRISIGGHNAQTEAVIWLMLPGGAQANLTHLD